MTVLMPAREEHDGGVEISVRGVCREYTTQSRHEQHSESAPATRDSMWTNQRDIQGILCVLLYSPATWLVVAPRRVLSYIRLVAKAVITETLRFVEGSSRHLRRPSQAAIGQCWLNSERAYPLHGLASAKEFWRYVLRPSMV